jgi:hypothetical protein
LSSRNANAGALKQSTADSVNTAINFFINSPFHFSKSKILI